jgi:hypothetical protein
LAGCSCFRKLSRPSGCSPSQPHNHLPLPLRRRTVWPASAAALPWPATWQTRESVSDLGERVRSKEK